VAWVLGNRDTATFRRLYEKVKHIKDCIFYTDNWSVFAEVLPPERHIAGKAHTVTMEQDNSNTRRHLGRFTRRSKIVSKKVAMVDLTLKLWQMLTLEPWFEKYQAMALSIYK
jgi:insertion element IS1 protein InsB